MRRTYLFTACVAMVLGHATRGVAEDAVLGDPLTLNAVVAYARAHNPEIRAAYAGSRAAQARPAQAGTLPDPMLDVAYHDEGFQRLRLGDTEFAYVRVGASQEVPFPGKLGLKREIAAQSAEQTGAMAQRTEFDVISRVKQAYADYAHLDELLDLLHRNQTLLEKLARTAEGRYAVGQGIQQDVLRAHLELSLLIDRETTLAQRRQSQTAALNALLDRPASAALGDAEHPAARTLTRSLEDLTAAAHVHSPELRSAALGVASSETGVSLARREYFPDFVVRADYMQKSALLPEWEVGIGVKVPLYLATKQRAGVEEAAALLAQARAASETTEVDVAARIKDLYARAQASERLIALYRSTVIPQAQLATESATAAYEVAKVDFTTLLNSFTVMLEYEMRYHEELAEFQKAVAELEAVVGERLEESDVEPTH